MTAEEPYAPVIRDFRVSSSGREVRAPQAGTEFALRSYVTGPGSAMVADWDAESAIMKGYYANVFVWACVRALAEDVAALVFRAGLDPAEPEEYDEESALARLLGAPPYGPNRYTTGRQLLAWSVAQLLVTGRFAWELAYPGARSKTRPESLWPLAASRFEPVVSEKPGRYFDNFVYNRGTGKPITLSEEQVLYYWRPSQSDWRQPESSLQAARLDVSVAVMQDRYDYAFLRNDARPATVVVHQAFAERGARDSFREQFVASHAGPDNAGRTAFVETSEDGATPKESLLIQQVGLSQRDAQFIERYDRKLRAIIVAFGVPMSRLGDASERTYSNAGVEYEVYLRDRVLPLVREIQDAINLQLSPRIGRELGWFDVGPLKSAVRGARLQAAGLPDLLKSRVIKINEARHALDLESVDDGDRFLTDVELGLLQNGAATLVVPATTTSAEPYERGQDVDTSAPAASAAPPAEAPEPSVPEKPEPPEPPKPEPEKRSASGRTARETRRLRHYRSVDELAKEHEAAFEEAYQAILDAQLKHVESRLTGKRGRQMLRVGAEGRQSALDPSQVFDEPYWRDATASQVQELYRAIAAGASLHLAQQLAIDLGLSSEWADAFIQARANQLAWNVTDTTYAGIKDALSQGVAAGEAIPDLVDRIRNLFQQTYANRARTVARTEVISAYNGATATIAQQSPAGIAAMEWLATPGSRTRASHRQADGQQQPVGGTFSVGGHQMAYPGDPSAPAREVVNCRCALTLLTADDLALAQTVDPATGQLSPAPEGALPRWTTAR